ncbi:MAG: hypothetical protein ACK506_16295 [Pirellula sp.]
MSEKRKPELIFFAEIQGNGTENRSTRKRLAKIELFPAMLWADVPKSRIRLGTREVKSDVYRIRINGKWWNPSKTYTLSHFFAIYRNAVHLSRKKFRRKLRMERNETT